MEALFQTAVAPPTDLAAGTPFPRCSCCLHGWEGELQDFGRALRLYEQAAKLGAPLAFLELAHMYGYGTPGSPADPARAIACLKAGANRGARWCWAELSDAYLGIAWSAISHPDNARKSLRNFFTHFGITVVQNRFDAVMMEPSYN
jgi:TPR repeat protein